MYSIHPGERFVAAVVIAAVACSPNANSGGDRDATTATMSEACRSLGVRYADEVHDYALGCDPAVQNPCGGQLPTIVYEQLDDGGLEFDGISSSCSHAVNPTRTDAAAAILNDYAANGCPYRPTPICTATANQCSVSHPDGGMTCF
jgi:hypothetical protein